MLELLTELENVFGFTFQIEMWKLTSHIFFREAMLTYFSFHKEPQVSPKKTSFTQKAEGTHSSLWCLLAYQNTCWPPGSSHLTCLLQSSQPLLADILAVLTSTPA